jgi:ADP-ribose pyrophosphatase
MNDDDAHLVETQLASELSFKGRLLEVRSDKVKLPSGGTGTREFVVHPGAALVVPVLDDGRLVLERQFRYPVRRVMLEFPAGKLDPGEAPLACAQARARGGGGLCRRDVEGARDDPPEIGYSTEFIEMYEATGLTHVGQRLDEGEFLDIVAMSEEELLATYECGGLTDGKSGRCAVRLAPLQREMSPALDARPGTDDDCRCCREAPRRARPGAGWWVTAMRQCRLRSRWGVKGWVRNRSDGTVEAHVQGPPESVQRYAEWCEQGPAARARVQGRRDDARGRRGATRLRLALDRLTARRRRCPSTPRTAPPAIHGNPSTRPTPVVAMPASTRMNMYAPSASIGCGLRANARSDDAKARTQRLAVEQGRHRHEGQRQRDEHVVAKITIRPTAGRRCCRPGTRRLTPAIDHANALRRASRRARRRSRELCRQRRRERHEEVLEARRFVAVGGKAREQESAGQEWRYDVCHDRADHGQRLQRRGARDHHERHQRERERPALPEANRLAEPEQRAAGRERARLAARGRRHAVSPRYAARTFGSCSSDLASPSSVISPDSITYPRRLTSSASFAFCSMSRIVTPSFDTVTIVSNTFCTMSGASPIEGSSRRQQLRPRHHGASHRQHLLLAARQRAGGLAAPLLEAREEIEHALDVGLDAVGVGADVRAHREVLLDGERAEHAAAFRHHRKPALHERVRRPAGDVLARVMDGAPT